MGLVYLEHGVTIYHADALSIHDNFIAECGSCIELRGWGQASKVTDNLLGAGYKGYIIFAQNFGGLLITANNIFPRGMSSVHFDCVARSTVTGNRFHSFYPGMLILEKNCSENLISSNHFYRSCEPWVPLKGVDNGLDDQYGILYISGNNNSVIGNHFSEIIDEENIRPVGTKPVILHVAEGTGNYIATNHIVAVTEAAQPEDAESCFSTQVEAMLSTDHSEPINVIAVKVENRAEKNVILDSGNDDQVILDRKANAFRPTPQI